MVKDAKLFMSRNGQIKSVPFYTFIAIALLMTCGCALAQSTPPGDNALSLFEGQVSKIESFMRKPQTALIAYVGTKPGFFYLARFYGQDVKYDVRRSDSLVSPYTAYVQVSMATDINGACGPVKMDYLGGVGWPTEEQAVAQADRAECFRSKSKRPPFLASFNYAFQQSKWTLKSVTFHYFDEPLNEKSEEYLSSVLDAPVGRFSAATTKVGRAFNKEWREAFLP